MLSLLKGVWVLTDRWEVLAFDDLLHCRKMPILAIERLPTPTTNVGRRFLFCLTKVERQTGSQIVTARWYFIVSPDTIQDSILGYSYND